ncbi:hypothetical protein [Hyphococcus sp.]|uniref:hypothetical protein n=1 Tax=Hyphococcus sp. TaxID=2038636 RepID=UPI00208CE53C|nr:MAG: hypothetical protein DHS20C04_13020 [Marinicaulis sp.]
MTAFLLLAKGVLLIVLSLAAFTALAWMLGFEPAIAQDGATRCATTPAPICMFTII